jgi:hypothetical protein
MAGENRKAQAPYREFPSWFQAPRVLIRQRRTRLRLVQMKEKNNVALDRSAGCLRRVLERGRRAAPEHRDLTRASRLIDEFS